LGTERRLGAQIRDERRQFANIGALAASELTVLFAGISLQFERFRPAAENRGVPGSSPGLAISETAC
jgi:hypothetical protein